VGDQELLAFGLEKAAVLAALDGDSGRAGRLAGAADALRESTGIERSGFDGEWLARHLGRVGGDEFETAKLAGRELDAEEALHEARGA
jgi:hypothetical protein